MTVCISTYSNIHLFLCSPIFMLTHAHLCRAFAWVYRKNHQGYITKQCYSAERSSGMFAQLFLYTSSQDCKTKTSRVAMNYIQCIVSTREVMVNYNNIITEKALSKKCRNRSCRDALPAKKHFLKNQQNKRQCIPEGVHRLSTHHSAMHLPRTYHPYIFPTTSLQ